jgi:hypothetical protein
MIRIARNGELEPQAPVSRTTIPQPMRSLDGSSITLAASNELDMDQAAILEGSVRGLEIGTASDVG